MINKVCVVGSGVLGCYMTKKLLDEGFEVHLFDVGDKKVLNEEEIGFRSSSDFEYSGAREGRYFGLGGTSEKWGGQILLFDKKDFKNPNKFLSEIVTLNELYSECVYEKLNLVKTSSKTVQSILGREKTGYWLHPNNRNLFNFFKLKNHKNLKIYTNHLLSKINYDNGKIESLVFIRDKKKIVIKNYLKYFIAVGAFEHAKIYMDTFNIQKLNFNDHYSLPIAKIKSNGKLLNHNLLFEINKDLSFITNRLVGEINNDSYFLNPIYNSDFSFFQFVKEFLFKKNFNFKLFLKSFLEISDTFKFIFNSIFLKNFYVFKDEWILQLDFEDNSISNTFLKLDNKQLDKFGKPSLNIYKTNTKNDSKNDSLLINEILKKIRVLIEKNEIDGELLLNNPSMCKTEDTYHPYNILSDYKTLKEYLNEFENAIIISTAILPRVGGLNPTATLFPIIEKYIDEINLQK